MGVPDVGEASTSKTDLAFKEETTAWGTFAGGQMQGIARTSDTLSHQNNETQDQSMSSDRMTEDGQVTGATFGGQVQASMRVSNVFHPLYGAASFSDMGPTIALTVVDASFTAADQSLNSATGFATVPAVGQYVYLIGDPQPGNTGLKRVLTATANKLTFQGTSIVNSTAGNTKVRGMMMRGPGTVVRPVTLEKMISSAIFLQWYGCLLNTFGMNISAGNAIATTWDIMARSTGTTDASISVGGYLPRPQAPFVGPVSGVYAQIMDGAIYKPGTRPDYMCTSFQYSIANNLSSYPELGILGPADMIEGNGEMTGTSTILSKSKARIDQVRAYSVAHMGTVAITPGTGMVVTSMPRARLVSGDPQTSGQNQATTLPIGFRAEKDPALNCRWQWDFIDLTGL